MLHDARNVANQILTMAQRDQHPITPAELTRTVYLAHAFMLACHHVPLIKDEVEAWQQGPVISKLHQNTKFYGNTPVTQHIEVLSEKFAAEEHAIILSAWRIHCTLEEPELASITTGKGTPWHRKWHNTRDKSVIIQDEDIRNFYLNITNNQTSKRGRPNNAPGHHPEPTAKAPLEQSQAA